MRDGPPCFVVLGDPVEHSLSPVMHSAALEALGIDAVYHRRRVDREGMVQAASDLRTGELDGANITMPFKSMAADLADDLSGDAGRAHSVNTWVLAAGRIEGHSTDVIGVRRVIEERGLPDGPAVVLGSGGAAAATLVALEGRPITIIARRSEAAQDLAQSCGVDVTVLPWDDPAPAGLVINCTPIGMSGETMPERMLEAATGYFEMAYASGETPAERLVASRMLPVAGGVSLLAAQAEESFELWFGVTPPAGLMYRSVDKYLKGDAGGVES